MTYFICWATPAESLNMCCLSLGSPFGLTRGYGALTAPQSMLYGYIPMFLQYHSSGGATFS